MLLILKAVIALLVIYVFVLIGSQYLQRRLMYFPDTTRFTPEQAGLSGVTERELLAPDGEHVIAWYSPARAGAPTILYFHGNGGALETRRERIKRYQERGVGMFMMTYRGYGGSSGQPSEKSNVTDGKRAYDALVASGVPASDIIIYGESLGTGVAVQVAAEKPAAGLILDAPYTSMLELARLHYPSLPRWLMTDRYETLSHIGKVKAPLLIIHGDADEVIPVAMGKAVFDAANAPKEIATFPAAGHSDHYKFGSYDKIFAWIARLRAGKLTSPPAE